VIAALALSWSPNTAHARASCAGSQTPAVPVIRAAASTPSWAYRTASWGHPAQ
jgi:hypothetical protein